MAGGGSSEVKETSLQRAQADIANEQWNTYQSDLKQYEDLFMDKVDNLNSESNYTKVAGDAATQTSSAFGQARQKTADNLAASGVDPTSGKYQAAMSDITKSQVTSQIDTTDKAQNDQASKYTAGLSDVVSLGAGQKADALSGYSSLARSSAAKASADAEASYNEHAGLVNAIGTAAGGYASYSMANAAKSPVSSSDGVGSLMDSASGKTLSSNQANGNPYMKTYFGGR